MAVHCRLGRLPDSNLELKVNSLVSLPVSYHFSHNVYLHSSSTLFVSKHFQSTHFLPTTFLTPPHFPPTHFLSTEHLAFPSSLDLPLFLTDHFLYYLSLYLLHISNPSPFPLTFYISLSRFVLILIILLFLSHALSLSHS
jgi:hypothetical protein